MESVFTQRERPFSRLGKQAGAQRAGGGRDPGGMGPPTPCTPHPAPSWALGGSARAPREPDSRVTSLPCSDRPRARVCDRVACRPRPRGRVGQSWHFRPGRSTLHPGPSSESSLWGGFADGGSRRRPARSLCRREPVRPPSGPRGSRTATVAPKPNRAAFRGAKPGSSPLARLRVSLRALVTLAERLGRRRHPRPVGARPAGLGCLPGVAQRERETRAADAGRPAVTSAACRVRPQPGSARSAVRPAGPPHPYALRARGSVPALDLAGIH